jgi:lysophospholipase L1-like esterase
MNFRVVSTFLMASILSGNFPAMGDDAAPHSPKNAVIQLFNGRNLDGLYTWLHDTKREDSRKVFTVEDGMLHISGDGMGYVCTKSRYKNYRLVVEYRWGERTWQSRKTNAKDTGIILHCTEPDGSFNRTFMAGIEAQIIQGGTGDLLIVSGKRADGSQIPVSLTAETAKDRDGEMIWKKGGERRTLRPTQGAARINWFGRDPDWKDVIGYRGPQDLDSPGKEWTRLDVICDGGHIQYYVNGVLANEGFDAQPSEGNILLQTECAEVYCRRLELHPLDEPWPFDTARLKPFWQSDTMDGESVLFVQDGKDAQPRADLLFEPTKILSVCNSSGEVIYVEGRDYVWHPGTREITLPQGSRIPSKTPHELRRPAGSQPFPLTHRDGKGEILFGGGHEYHDMQTAVTYEHKPNVWQGTAASFAGDRLPLTIQALKEKRSLTIAVLGDSISTGCNASGWAKTAPFQPAYDDLLAAKLEKDYGAKVTVKNFAVGGTDTGWGLANITKVLGVKPDLVIFAFGMNDDPGGRSAESYQANIKAMIDAVRKVRPKTEFILVATMLGNPDWTLIHPELFPQYRDALAKLCGPGIALADMTSIWAELLKRKKYWDLTGNGVNHPNDFGHRVYAEVLSSLLICNP